MSEEHLFCATAGATARAMSIPCTDCRHFGVGFEAHARSDIAHVERFRKGHEAVPRGQVIADARHGPFLFTLYSGFAVRLGRGSEGKARANALLLPGALVGMPTLFCELPDVQIVAASDVTVCRFDDSRLGEVLEIPSLAERVIRISALQALAADRLANAIRTLPAPGRLAYFLWDLYLALDRRRLARDMSFTIPVLRRHLADILGLTPMHFRRSCTRLEDLGIATFDGGRAHIHDMARLQALAGHHEPMDAVPWML